MRPKSPPQTPEPDPRYPGVECGDTLVFQHPQRGPTALKVLAQGRHGVTGVCPLGDRFRVRWRHILGHKERVQRRFEVVEHGEDGVIVRDQDGVRRWLHSAPDETNGRSGETQPRSRETQEPHMTKSQPSAAQIEAGNYPKKHLRFQGLAISIENPKGSTRSGTDRGGKAWTTTMRHDYGYVRGTCGVDKDHVDCYIGPDPEATTAYIVHQRKAGQWDQYDEDKVMLGFSSEAAARTAYLQHYDDPRFLGPITAMPMDEFKRKALATAARPAMIKGKVLFLKSMVRGHIRRLASGKMVTVQPYHDKRTKKGDSAASGDLFAERDPEPTPKPRRTLDEHSTSHRRVSDEPAPTPPQPGKEPEPTPPKPAPKANPFLDQTIAQTLQGKAASYWLGELVRDDDVRLDTKVMRWPTATMGDFGLAIYENGKKTWAAPFPGLTWNTTNQQAARMLVDYLNANGKENQRLNLRMEKIGERHASEQEQAA